ncbi:MAG TPA: hypothetical protein ENN99_00875, partial [Chloroflexi bacterium]|nr:hypothetical protein [Chloroflexota bacterium]
QDRAFARFYPTIAVDGCDKRCAARGTEMYSGKPAAEIVVTDLIAGNGLGGDLGSARRLNGSGSEAVDLVAERIAQTADELLGVKWDRRRGRPAGAARAETIAKEETEAKVASCACGSGIPIQKVSVNGKEVTFIALPLIFEQFHQQGKSPAGGVAEELMNVVKIYTPIPEGEEETYTEAVLREYAAFYRQKEEN